MIPLFLNLRGPQLIIILVLIILLFGAKRIPSLMRNLGKSVHAFKQGIAEAETEMKKPVKSDSEDTEKKEIRQTADAKDRDDR